MSYGSMDDEPVAAVPRLRFLAAIQIMSELLPVFKETVVPVVLSNPGPLRRKEIGKLLDSRTRFDSRSCHKPFSP